LARSGLTRRSVAGLKPRAKETKSCGLGTETVPILDAFRLYGAIYANGLPESLVPRGRTAQVDKRSILRYNFLLLT